MKEPPDLRELVGEDMPPEELARLHEVDSLLRRVPAPPHDVPAALTQAVASVPVSSRPERRLRRLSLGLAFAAAVGAAAFAIGQWNGSKFDVDYTVDMAPTASVPGAEAAVKVGFRDEESGNVELLVDVSGLPRLPEDEDYALWLEKDGEWAGTCGYFDVGEGTTTVRLTVSYDFRDFDAWVISTGNFEEPVTLLEAEIPKA
jgi:Anti-sigma-K factor rskA